MTNTTHFTHYASVADMHHDAHKPFKINKNAELVHSYLSGENRGPSVSWYGMDGGAPAVLKALTDGFPEGEAKVDAFRSEIVTSLPRALGHHRAKQRGEFGDELDIHSVYRGALDKAWTSSVRRIRKGTGVLRLVIDIGGNAHTCADELQWRGVAGMSLAEVMSKAGYSVEIVAAQAVNSPAKGINTVSTCIVKPRSSQVDKGLLAATVCLPGFFRVLGFSAIVRACDNADKTADSGLGQYLAVSGMLPVPDKVTQLCVPGTVMNKKSALTFVRESVELLQGARA
jgi:hypothetical protein